MKRRIYISALIVVSILMSCSKDSPTPTPTPIPTPTIEDPGKATLVSPANNKTCEEVNSSGQVTFSWNASSDTTKYDLEITNLNTQGKTNFNNITTTSKEVTLPKGVPYSWQITSKNKGTVTTNSDKWLFYLAGEGITNYAPFPATAISPTPGATVTPSEGKVTIQWDSSDVDQDQLTYTLYVDTQDGLQNTVQIENITEKSTSINVVLGTVYYWRVKTSDGRNTSTSIVYTFRTTS